jgi:hypothetical protein
VAETETDHAVTRVAMRVRLGEGLRRFLREIVADASRPVLISAAERVRVTFAVALRLGSGIHNGQPRQ